MSISKSIWMSLLLLLTITCAFAQPALSLNFKYNGVFIDHKKKSVCPGLDVEYQISNWKPSAHTLTVVNGKAASQ